MIIDTINQLEPHIRKDFAPAYKVVMLLLMFPNLTHLNYRPLLKLKLLKDKGCCHKIALERIPMGYRVGKPGNGESWKAYRLALICWKCRRSWG